MEQSCQQITEQVKDVEEKNEDELPDGLKLVQAKFVLETDSLIRPTAVDIGTGDVSDPRHSTRVLLSRSLLIYMKTTSSIGNLKIWKVTNGRFMFSSQEPTPRYITAFSLAGRWYPIWMDGSDPVGVTEANMDEDDRVWEVFRKFSYFFIRLQKQKNLYLNAGEEFLEMIDVGDDPEDTRNVTPLTVS